MLPRELVVPLSGKVTAEQERLGGKGHNLLRLSACGFPVPGGFVITTEAFLMFVEAASQQLQHTSDLGAWLRAMNEAPFPEEVWLAVKQASDGLRRMFGPSLVVRSSAVGEDGSDTSMAGQNASFIDVVGDKALARAIRGCWASLFSEESIVYRAGRPDPFEVPAMAVVVQTLVPANRAGVVFTMNPLTGRDSEMLVSASWGLGEDVVAGRSSETAVLDSQTGELIRHEVPAEGPAASKSARPALDIGLCREVHSLASRIRAAFGRPQDIEWAEHRGRVYVVQTRPVTGLSSGGRRSVWSNANVGEALPGVATPYTWSIIRGFSKKGVLHAFRGLGCQVPAEYSIVGGIRGRVYLNLSEFMSVASQIPFVTPKMLAQLAGGGGVEDLPGTYRKLSSGRFLAEAPASMVRFALSRALSPARVALWAQRFRDFRMSFLGRDLAALSSHELLDLSSEVDRIFEETGTLLMECSGHFLAHYMAVTMLLWATQGKRAGVVQRELFSGLAGIRSAEPGLDLLRMAGTIRKSPQLVSIVTGSSAETLLEDLAAGPPEARSLLLAFQAFLSSHGHRAVRETELSVPRWSEDPTFPLATLQQYVLAKELPDAAELLQARVRKRQEVTRQVLDRLPAVLRPGFERLLRQSQASAREREDLRSSVVLTIGFYRSLALEIGRRMVEDGLVATREDVFLLHQHEQREYLLSRRPPSWYHLATVARAAALKALQEIPDPPQTVVMEGDRMVPRHDAVPQGLQLSGLAGSPGSATGRAVVVTKPEHRRNVVPGSILVAPSTDVGWTPLFLVVAGVVTELGGPLSHACVVAREYGVPAVVNVPRACSFLKDGDLVTVDGDGGRVVLIKQAES